MNLPDPELGSAFRDWSDEEINNLRNKIRKSDLNYDNKTFKFDIEIPKKLYHLTIKEYCKNINKSGPIPKSKLSSHLDRNYGEKGILYFK